MWDLIVIVPDYNIAFLFTLHVHKLNGFKNLQCLSVAKYDTKALTSFAANIK